MTTTDDPIQQLHARLPHLAPWLQPFQIASGGQHVEFHNARGTPLFYLSVSRSSDNNNNDDASLLFQLYAAPSDASPVQLGCATSVHGLILLLNIHCR